MQKTLLKKYSAQGLVLMAASAAIGAILPSKPGEKQTNSANNASLRDRSADGFGSPLGVFSCFNNDEGLDNCHYTSGTVGTGTSGAVDTFIGVNNDFHTIDNTSFTNPSPNIDDTSELSNEVDKNGRFM